MAKKPFIDPRDATNRRKVWTVGSFIKYDDEREIPDVNELVWEDGMFDFSTLKNARGEPSEELWKARIAEFNMVLLEDAPEEIQKAHKAFLKGKIDEADAIVKEFKKGGKK